MFYVFLPVFIHIIGIMFCTYVPVSVVYICMRISLYYNR